MSVALLFALILFMILPIETNAASTLKLSNKKLTIYVGPGCGTKTITVKGAPEGAKIKWKTSNKKVATVKNGVITPKKVGKVTITAQVNKKKLTCKVTVKEPKVYVANRNNAKFQSSTVTSWGGAYLKEWVETAVGKDIPEGQYKVVPLFSGEWKQY